MEAWQERVVNEYGELSEKYNKLEAFVSVGYADKGILGVIKGRRYKTFLPILFGS